MTNRALKNTFEAITGVVMVIATIFILLINSNIIVVNDKTNTIALCFAIVILDWVAFFFVKYAIPRWNDMKFQNLLDSCDDEKSEVRLSKIRRFFKNRSRRRRK